MKIVPYSPRLLTGSASPLDLLVGALGYERRSLRVPSEFSTSTERVVLLDLRSPGQGSYDSNLRLASGWADSERVKADELKPWFLQQVAALIDHHQRPIRAAVDISCLPRDRIAHLIDAVHTLDALGGGSTIHLFYTPAIASAPSSGPEPIEILGPVTPSYAGALSHPDVPVVAFIGLGGEQDRAIGALEYLEPARIWAFVPTGEDEAFDRALIDANRWVWRVVPETQRIAYRVDDPYSLFEQLEQLVNSEISTARPIVVPLGPKIFAAASMLVALAHPQTSVWRVTPGRFAAISDHDSNGKLVGLTLELGTAATE